MSADSFGQRWDMYGDCGSVDPELFFPEHWNSLRQITLAKRICAECVVLEDCLDDIWRGGVSDGVKAGMTPGEQRAYTNVRRIH